MDGKSQTPQQEKIDALRQLLPEAFTEGKIDWEKLKATLDEEVNFRNERYVLNWAGKSEAFRVLQTPTTKTLAPAKEESINFDQTENIFIEGENMEVLKALQKSYFGKVKMIYIDPPYNTGNDSFIYPDKFSERRADYEKRVGDKDEEGYLTKDGMFRKNSKENGQYHSNWLNMMMPRLYLSKNLLRQDGVIFVSIDDNEVHNLRLLMNEVFGEENFVSEIVWERSYAPINMVKHFSKSHDYVLCYAKSIELLDCNGLPRPDSTNSKYGNPDNDPRGLWRTDNLSVGPVIEEKVYEIITPSGRKCLPPKGRCWLYTRERYKEMIADNRIWFGEDGNNIPSPKRFLSEVKQGLTPMTIWKYKDVGHNQDSMRELRELFDGEKIFDYSKPVKLIKQMIQLYTLSNDITLDFFAGSSTTAHAVMDLNKEDVGNRKYICVQLPELTDEKSEAYKAGYTTIADISKERIRRAATKIGKEIEAEVKKLNKEIAKLQSELPTDETKAEIETLQTKIEQLQGQDLGFKVLKLSESNFKQWQQIDGKDAKALEEQMKLFVDPVAESATMENMVYELLLKSGKDLNSKIENHDGYYVINDRELVLMLNAANQEIIDQLIALKPIKVIALDKLFKGNDQLKTNTVLQMRDAGVEFRTI